MEAILNTILPPKEFEEDGLVWRQQVSCIYLPNVYTISTQYLYNIYAISIHGVAAAGLLHGLLQEGCGGFKAAAGQSPLQQAGQGHGDLPGQCR